VEHARAGLIHFTVGVRCRCAIIRSARSNVRTPAHLSALIPSLGRYQIQAQIGRGAMGTVYRALDPVLERPVAIKTLNPDLAPETIAEMKARFVREAKSAGRLNHPNIVTVYDADVAGELAYIAMEYLEGQSLQQMLQAGTPLAFDSIADIVAQVAEGLDYAGRFGIVHRDIKPANIMVSPAGLAKITDFGLARVPSSSMTQAGSVLGSPKYMSPEQVQEQPVDPRADIFSLGAVLYELLVGKTPFETPGMDLLSLMDRIVKEPVPKASEQRPGIPAEMDAIIERALAKDPAARFQRAGEFARRLRELTTATAGTPFALDAEPSGDNPAAQTSLSKLLADLEAFSRGRAQSAEAANELSLQLRKAFHYLEELVRQVIQANPPFAVKLDLIYLGALPAAYLSQGRVDTSSRMLGDAEVVDCLNFTYRMQAQRKARIALKRGEARLLRSRLEQAGLRFDSREVADAAGRVGFEAFLIDVDLNASAALRADYEQHMVEITCQNVGVLGPAKYRLPSAEFDEAIWEFGQLLLGLPSRFAGLRLPAGKSA
jgi:serine/threonine protein kinase